MKIIHTSDWHLGQSFFSKSRKDEHQEFLNWLLTKVVEEQVDAIIVAGDIFDTATPPSYAREMYNRFVVDLQPLRCSLVVLGGNHDSVAVLNESKPLIEQLNSYVVASTDLPLEEQLLALRNARGDVAALVCAVPFIRTRDVLQSQADESAEQKVANLGEAIQQHYHRLYDYALSYKAQHQLQAPIIMTGHLSALGASLSESVRNIYIGNLSSFPSSSFPPADYIALGHIHRPQIVEKKAHIRYSGSPIPLSFDELGTTKQVLLVEFGQEELLSVRGIDVPSFQPMAVLSGRLTEIEKQLQSFPSDKDKKPVWLYLQVEESDYLSDLQQRILAMTQGLHVEVLRLTREFVSNQSTLSQVQNETLDELTPLDVFAQCLDQHAIEDEHVESNTALEKRLLNLYNEVLAELEQEQMI